MKRKLERFRATLVPGAGEETTRFGEFVNEFTGEKIPYVDKLARIFKAGIHRGKTYTGADIDRLVSNFPKPSAEIEWDRPVYKDHNPENRSIENMVGNIRSLERRGEGMGSQLWGWLRFIGQDSVNNVMSGLYRKLSAGIYYDTMEVDEVSVLADPYFTDTQVFSKNPKEAQAVSVKAKEDPAKEGDADQGKTEKHSQGDRSRKKRPESTLSTVNDKWEERFSKMEAANKQLVDQLNATKTELAEFRSDKVAMTASNRVEVFRAAGKTTKAMTEPEKAFVATLTPEQFGLYEKVKEVQPEFFSLETYGDPGEKFGEGAKRPGKAEDVKTEVKSLKEKYNKKGGNKDA